MPHNQLFLTIFTLITLLLIPTQPRTTKGVIMCINQIKLITKPQNLTSICDKDFNDKPCLKTVMGINQCLLLNDCLNSLEQQMDFHCWNCWADYTTDSHLISSFQDEVKTCKSALNLTPFFAFALLVFVTSMF